MKTKSILFVQCVFAIILFASCDNTLVDLSDAMQSDSKVTGSGTRKVNIHVEVKDEFNSAYFYRVEVYDKSPSLTDFNMLSVGVARADLPMKVVVVIPDSLKSLYIQQVDPQKNISMRKVSIDSKSTYVECNFSTDVVIVK